MKHADKIAQLDKLQKVALVSSALDGEPFELSGIAPINKAELSAAGRKYGISYGSAARSFDPELIEKMTGEVVAAAGAGGAKLFITPDLKTAINPYAAGLSEDGYFNGAVGASVIRGVHGAGGGVAVARPTVSESDINYLDIKRDDAGVYNFAVKPFVYAVENNPCDGVILDLTRIGAEYYEVNRSIFNEAQNGLFGDAFIVGEGETSTYDAVNMLKGKITLGGAKIPLERAVRRYEQLSEYKREGSVTQREIDDSIADGSALDDDKLNELTDNIIDFSERLNGLEIAADIGDEARRQIAAESVVMLKNNRLLPLKEGAPIALLGDFKHISPLRDKFSVVGVAEGYDRLKPRSDSYLPTAVRTTNNAEAAVVFLYPDPSGRELALPPNRIVLLNALKRARKKIIAVIVGDVPVDMNFDENADAVLIIPDGKYAGEALAEILCGKISPSGRLTRTAFDGADAYFRALRADRDSGRINLGAFTGYRRYDLENRKVRYPFGFGLSYSKFSYSSLHIGDEEITFTLTNEGQYDGAEVAQVYIASPSAGKGVPKKELKGFKRVYLRAGESQKVTIPLPQSAYKTFDGRLFAENIETGDYGVFVGASVLDIRLKGVKNLKGVTRERAAKNVNYFPNDDYEDLDVVNKEYRLGKSEDKTPVRLKNMQLAARYILPLLALVFFLLITVVILAYALDYILLSVGDAETVEWALYIVAVAALSLWPLLGSLNRKRLVRIRTIALIVTPFLILVCFILGAILLSHNGGIVEDISLRIVTCFAVGTPIVAVVSTLLERQLWRTKSGKNRWDKYYFEREREEKTTGDEEFEAAFKRVEENAKKREEALNEPVAPPEKQVVRFYDKRLTFVQMQKDCVKFLSERGFAVEDGVLRSFLAAILSSKLALVPAGGGAALAAEAAEYFGKPAYIDNAERYERYDDLFRQWRSSGNANYPTSLSVAMAMARREAAYLHVAIIRHVDVRLLSNLFLPFAEVLGGRRQALPAAGGKTIDLPENLLIIVEVEGEGSQIPCEIAEVAAFISPEFEECAPSEKKTILQSVGYERISAMLQPVRDFYPLDEELWKKVDELDGLCKTAHIGNRLWIKLELHSSIVAACGGSADEALDQALAAELIPWLVSVWDDKDCGLTLSAALTRTFGADKLRRSTALLKSMESKEEPKAEEGAEEAPAEQPKEAKAAKADKKEEEKTKKPTKPAKSTKSDKSGEGTAAKTAKPKAAAKKKTEAKKK